ncbi:hypothetical protein [Agromyces sp. CCNWLW203]|uniref:hypothetical protein n=1 Tax=Agromyces sp. CCNWLW203 TaxID=3112842 RepID=UPI002F96C509
MAGYTVGIAADTKAAKQGIETGLIKPLGDAADAVDKLGKSRGPDQLEDGMRDAQKATERLKDETKETADAIDREYRDAYRKMKQSSDDGLDGAKRGLDDFKSEAGQSGREAAASFSGGFDDVGDFAQETLANGLAGFGPIGAAAGIAAAVGLGALWASIEENSKKSEERVSDMYQAFLEAGSKYLSDEQVNQAIADLADDTGKWGEALAINEATGLSIQTILRAMVGDQEALNAATDAENEAHKRNIAEIQNGTAAMEDKAAAVLLENQRHADTIGKLQQIATDTDTAASKAAAVAAAYGTGNARLDEQVAKIQNVASMMSGLGDKTIRISADTTGVEGALARLQGRTISVNVNGQITRIGNQVW